MMLVAPATYYYPTHKSQIFLDLIRDSVCPGYVNKA